MHEHIKKESGCGGGGHHCGCAGKSATPMRDPQVDAFQKSLPGGHPLRTMIREHEVILAYLDELDLLNRRIQGAANSETVEIDLPRLAHVVAMLIMAEPHHKREEAVLFPALESRGVYGPPQVMRMEHELLRTHKHRLEALVSQKDPDLDALKQEINESATFLVSSLASHIFKENRVLYPMAMQTIQDAGAWESIKTACDGIGCCAFTPQEG